MDVFANLDLTRLLAPASVAVVGASERPGSYGGQTLLNLATAGFDGPVHAVNPHHRQVHGRPCVSSLADLPEPVDAVVVATPAATVPGVLDQAGRLGCGGAIVYATGFAEGGNQELQDEVRAVALGHGLPVVGPNANGVVSVDRRAPLWGDAVTLGRPGPVALVTQSGNVGVNALAVRHGLRLHTVVSVGNGAVVEAADVLAALARTDGVRSVALYLEDDGLGEVLAEALARCAEGGVRVAVLKSGRSAAGATVGAGHTAAVAGDQRVFRAVVEEAGGAWCHNPHELFETAKAMAGRPPSHHGGLAVVTCSGGDASIAADEAERLGVPLAALAEQTTRKLAGTLPSGTLVTNPLDHTHTLWADTPALAELLTTVLADPAVDQLVYLQDVPDTLGDSAAAEWAATRDALIEVARSQPDAALAFASTLPGLLPDEVAQQMLDHGIVPLAGMTSALRALEGVRRPLADPERLRAIGATAAVVSGGEPGRWLAEHEAKALLARHGVPVPPSEVATHPAEAVEIAQRLDRPVALKVSRPGLRHKSDAGALSLDVLGPASVAREAERLLDLAERVEQDHDAGAAVLLVETMADPGVEVMVGAHSDSVVPCLVLGLGGIWTELLDDVALVPLPVTPDRAVQAMRSLRGAPLLFGGRGRRAVDVEALGVLASRVGDLLLVADLDLIELNPVLVTEQGVVAVDALVRTRKAIEAPARSRPDRRRRAPHD